MALIGEACGRQPLGHRPPGKADLCGRERLVMVAPGCVRPTGWVKKVADLECDGFLEMIVREDQGNFRGSFYEGTATVFSGEHAGYWNDAVTGLALVAGRQDLWNGICERVEATLAAAARGGRFVSSHYNGWGVHLMTRALMTYFEASGDHRVLEFCHRVALEMADDLYTRGVDFNDHCVNFASSCAQLYYYTGDRELLSAGETIIARFDTGVFPNLSRLLHDERLAGHCVNYCEDIRYPADFFLVSGNPDHLAASVRGVVLTRRDHLQIQAAPTGNEMVYGTGPHKETEQCDAVEWSMVGHSLLTATGESEYADLAEQALFNAWAGSRKWDGKSLSYTHAPNQLTAATWEGDWRPRQNLSAFHWPQCCNLNSHRALAPYAFRMWMLATEGGIAAVYYGACELRIHVPGVGEVELVEKTDYPFDERVTIVVKPARAARFSIRLRIPGWCSAAEVRINGVPHLPAPRAGEFCELDRQWRTGDTIDLHLPMPLALEWGEIVEEAFIRDQQNPTPAEPGRTTEPGLRRVETPVARQHLVAVRRGPLVYALYIKPDYRLSSNDRGIPDYPVEDVVPAVDGGPWNVALVLNRDNPAGSFEGMKLEVPSGSAPFECPPIGLRCKAQRVPAWRAGGTKEEPATTLPGFPIEPEGDLVDVLLVPFGCTHIRLTWLPFVWSEEERDIA